MEQTQNFDSIHKYNTFNNNENWHPLVSLVDLSKANKRKGFKANFGFYCVFLKQIDCGNLKYGRNNYDYEEGTMTFVSPGQVLDMENKVDYYQPAGHAFIFHSDLLKGTHLAKKITEYHFFSYSSNEALHLSNTERSIIFQSLEKIRRELKQNTDKHSKTLITSSIELLLDYCQRFYDRQFITRKELNKGILESFEEILNGYFKSEQPQISGLLTVGFCADKLNLSANYFGDLIKKETGKTAQEYIIDKVIDNAKDKFLDKDKTINEIAYELGFKYPQHFSRMFKKEMGISPKEYRKTYALD